MAMEITNDYSNYAANYTDTMKKSGSNATREVMTSSKAKAQEYYEQLCKKLLIRVGELQVAVEITSF